MTEVSRREFLKYSAAAAGALALPELAPPVPARASTGCLWGAFADPKGYPSTIAAIRHLESLIRRRLALTRHYILWDGRLVNDAVRQSAAGGRIPFIAWQARRHDGTWVHWATIANGNLDAAIRRQARSIRDWGHLAYFVFNHEPENDTASGSAAEFKAAYDHIHNVFTANGVTNLKWVATLMRGTYAGAHGGANRWIPGTAGMVGVDGYNRGGCSLSNDWVSFRDLYAPAHRFAQRHGKGLVVEEWGCVEAGACGGAHTRRTKAEWLKAAGHTIKSWPEVKAVVYTHARVEYGGHAVDFRVNTSRSSLREYRRLGHEAYFH